ncbi:TraM recognition domain-containing protein [Streptacidiphilus sp. MAP12-20]|uniref:TraM recognition domain-containing protein n=1 Tax=Streptacidiphilus sp. MAP12-20 TaxID=3156299 RepID=UPI003518BE0A
MPPPPRGTPGRPGTPGSPGSSPGGRGIPDGAIVGLLAFLLGTTVLFWSATALGGLISHGRLPHPLAFTATAGAIRHLATAPNDLPGAWPATARVTLPSPLAFWLTFFALLALVLAVLLGLATARARHRVAVAASSTGPHPPAPRRPEPDAPQALTAARVGGGTRLRKAGRAGADGSLPPGEGDATRGREPRRSGAPNAGFPTDPSGNAPWAETAGRTDAHTTVPPGEADWALPPEARRTGAHSGSAQAAAETDAARLRETDRSGTPNPGFPTDVADRAGSGVWLPAAGEAEASRPRATGAGGPGGSDSAPGAASAPSWTEPPGASTGFGTTGGPHPDAGRARRPGRADYAYLPEQSVPGSVRRSAPPVYFVLPEGTTCVFAPEASAASRLALLGRVIAEAKTEPLLVVGADPALWAERPPYRRAARFDPQQLSGEDPEQPRGRWAPHTGCEDTLVATARAHALLLPTVRPAADAEEQGVRDLAETLLRCWLHAAALDGRPFRHVARWAAGNGGAGRQEAVAILNTTDAHRSGEGWGGLLQAALLRPSPTLDAALGRVRAALGALAELHILTACTPTSPSAALDPGALLRAGEVNSLYVLGHAGDARLREPRDGAALPPHDAMPLLGALVDDVFERARRTAVRSTAGRLDPPLLFVLDDIAAVAPFPGLPDLMSRGGPLGLRALTLLRSPEQARARWGERAVHSLWTSADHRAVLGPLAPEPLGALLAAVGSLDVSAQVGLDRNELLLLPGHGRMLAPQRFRIGHREP